MYGEYAGRLPENNLTQRARLLDRWRRRRLHADWNITAPLAPLNDVLAKNYPALHQAIPDVVRAQIFLKDSPAWRPAQRCRTW